LKKNIEDYIFLKENFLEEDFCDHSVDILSKAPWQTPWLVKPIEPQEQQVSSDTPLESELLDFNNLSYKFLQRDIKKIEDEIMRNIPDVLMEYLLNLKFDWLQEWTGYSGTKFNRYSLGQGMMKHWDNASHSFPELTGIAGLSTIGFLNDDYEGSDLIICEDIKIDTKKGNLVIFPSSFMYPHQVTLLTKGTRYSYVNWVYLK
jgi:hypothetical protein